jgi:hypothetical protein
METTKNVPYDSQPFGRKLNSSSPKSNSSTHLILHLWRPYGAIWRTILIFFHTKAYLDLSKFHLSHAIATTNIFNLFQYMRYHSEIVFKPAPIGVTNVQRISKHKGSHTPERSRWRWRARWRWRSKSSQAFSRLPHTRAIAVAIKVFYQTSSFFFIFL